MSWRNPFVWISILSAAYLVVDSIWWRVHQKRIQRRRAVDRRVRDALRAGPPEPKDEAVLVKVGAEDA